MRVAELKVRWSYGFWRADWCFWAGSKEGRNRINLTVLRLDGKGGMRVLRCVRLQFVASREDDSAQEFDYAFLAIAKADSLETKGIARSLKTDKNSALEVVETRLTIGSLYQNPKRGRRHFRVKSVSRNAAA